MDSVLTGASRLVKTDLGTLVLNAANTYTGGTDINGGTVQIASDSELGPAGTAIGMNAGTLRTTQSLAQSRAITLGAQGGGVEPLAGTTLTLAGNIGGAGSLTKLGAGTAILTGSNSYGGGTVVRTASPSSRLARCRWAMAASAATSWARSAMMACWRSTARTAMSRPT